MRVKFYILLSLILISNLQLLICDSVSEKMVKLSELKDSLALLIVTNDGDKDRNTSQFATFKEAKFSTVQALQGTT